jgi:hypothetical protein
MMVDGRQSIASAILRARPAGIEYSHICSEQIPKLPIYPERLRSEIALCAHPGR